METILLISVLMQIIAAYLAIRLIRITEARAAWLFITIGLVLMAVRRLVPILPILSIPITRDIEIINEIIAVSISVFMVLGIAFIAPLFIKIKKSEDALRESEGQYRTLVENLNVGVYRNTTDHEGRFIRANQAIARIFGYESVEDFMRLTVSDLYENHEDRKAFIEKILRLKSVKNEELKLKRKDGTQIIASITASAEFDKEGQVKWIDGVLEDITERKIAEEKLKNSEQRLYSVIQGYPTPTFVIDKDHKIIYWNKALERLSGIRAEEIVGTNQHWRAFYANERPCMVDILIDGAQEDLPRWYNDKYIKSPFIEEAYEATDFFPALGNGGRWLRFTAALIRDSQGEIVGAIETLEDITEKKQAEEKLKDSEQRLYSVIQGSPIPTFVIDKDHKIIYWNKALEGISGVKESEVLGTSRQWWPFYPNERPSMADLLINGDIEILSKFYTGKYYKSPVIKDAYEATDFFPSLGKGGRWLRFTAALIRNFNGEIVGAIETLEDITERRRAEEELIKIKKIESLGIFAGGIAHDFNNLLSIMLRNIFIVKLSLTNEQKALEEGLEIAEKFGMQAKELAHRLSTFSKGGELIRKEGSIAQLLKESVPLSLTGSQSKYEFNLPDYLWLVDMDEVHIRQVIHNLVINASESMNNAGVVSIGAENIYLTTKDGLPLNEGPYVKWYVRDSGVGIPDEDIDKIFDPYFTTKPSGTSRGMGMGLAICYSIIHKHEGFISVDSNRGVGSTFFVYLPAKPKESDFRKIVDEQQRSSKGIIMLVNDDEMVCYSTGIVLNYLGYDVHCLKNGREAIENLKKYKNIGQKIFAIILYLESSCDMGEANVLRELLKIDPHLNSILATGYLDDTLMAAYKEQGFKKVLKISYDMESMKKALDELRDLQS